MLKGAMGRLKLFVDNVWNSEDDGLGIWFRIIACTAVFTIKMVRESSSGCGYIGLKIERVRTVIQTP
jgi:hypothetical protein